MMNSNPLPGKSMTLSGLQALPLRVLSVTAGVACLLATTVFGRDDISYRQEVQHAIDRGLEWLQANQKSNQWWSTPDQPAVTALALMSFKGEPGGRYSRQEPDWLKGGYRFLLQNVHPDGSINHTNMVTYNTSICMMALLVSNQPEYQPIIWKARRFLVGLQSDFGEKGKLDTPFDGGIGYGSHYEHSDMGNTLAALEALYYSKSVLKESTKTEPDLNWNAAIHFLQACQNLPSHNHEAWVSDIPADRGGFVYYPGNSMAGGTTNSATGKVALRSYGSISYAGLLSYIYADLKHDDPRVTAVMEWLKRNYSLDENPGMGPAGKYYYFNTMTKALAAYGVKDLELADGRKVSWRREVSQQLLNLQQRDGSWSNESNRWWEKDPSLVTSYAVLSLERIYAGL